MMADERINLIVLFGGQSAEHDVSCVTATHVLRAVDRTRFRITPVGIGRDGQWHLATEALAALQSARRSAFPNGLTPAVTRCRQRRCSPLPPLKGPWWCCRCCTDRWAKTARCKECSNCSMCLMLVAGVLGSAVSMDKAVAKELSRVPRFAQA